MESTQSNLLLIEDNLFFYNNNVLKMYKLKSMNQDPEKTNIILNTNVYIMIYEYNNNNIIIKTANEIIKYDFILKQIKLRITTEYEAISVTKNFILGFKNLEVNILSKNFDIIQIKRFLLFVYFNKGIELNDKIVLLSSKHNKTRIVSYKKNIIKAIILAILRYLFFGIVCCYCYISIKCIKNCIIQFDFLKFDFCLVILLFFWSYFMIKDLLFNYFNYQRALIILPSDFL